MTMFKPVCRVDDIPRQGARVVANADGDIAIFRTFDDQIFALRDRCPHKGGPLSEGMVHADKVTCPLHNWTIALSSGEALPPDTGCAAKFAVKIVNGEVFLQV